MTCQSHKLDLRHTSKSKASRPYWPNFLFHYADVTAVAAIIREGMLRSRASQQHQICEVAEPGALAANPEALRYVRLHFRPKNHFHLSTEGIKFRGEERRLHADFEDVINNNGVQIGPFISDQNATWKIDIEEVLAFEGHLPHRRSELIPPA